MNEQEGCQTGTHEQNNLGLIIQWQMKIMHWVVIYFQEGNEVNSLLDLLHTSITIQIGSIPHTWNV